MGQQTAAPTTASGLRCETELQRASMSRAIYAAIMGRTIRNRPTKTYTQQRQKKESNRRSIIAYLTQDSGAVYSANNGLIRTRLVRVGDSEWIGDDTADLFRHMQTWPCHWVAGNHSQLLIASAVFALVRMFASYALWACSSWTAMGTMTGFIAMMVARKWSVIQITCHAYPPSFRLGPFLC
ncbi:hypothetical protein BDZ89DRAFT_311641 [Hymenopellis radicata]|nr:hypothetical protein BDZ89DRAFT_311641 [Hymenopellis radicata]